MNSTPQVITPLIALLMPCGLGSCDKAGKLVGELTQKSESTTAAHSGPLVTEVPAGAYDSFPRKPGKVVIIDFYADWCGPCRKLSPILEELASENQGKVLIGKVNVDNNRDLAKREGVRGIPDVRIYQEGRFVEKFVGIPPVDQLRRRIADLTKDLPAPAEAVSADHSKPTAKPSGASPGDEDLPPGLRRRVAP